ncbi:MAG: hypothetical protein ACOC6H_04695 [Thermoproteota archaeon]
MEFKAKIQKENRIPVPVKIRWTLKLEQVHDVLSYYYENRGKPDEKIKEDREFI